MAKPLYTKHERALTTLYSDLESQARSRAVVFVGTAGSVLERVNQDNVRYYSHQYYDGDGKKTEKYVAGPVGAPEADAKAVRLRERIADAKELVPSLRLLGREHYNIADPKTYATIASLYNHGVFTAGGVLVGSHAYGALLNHLGVLAQPYATEDIDIARAEKLAFAELPKSSFLDMLRDSGVAFIEVPKLNHREPSTSFKECGRSRFHVDLLVPSDNESFPIVEVPELKAHATGLPYLRYLLAETQAVALLARQGCCTIRVPVPHRMAIHKLLVSQLRSTVSPKARKDIDQACVLLAAVGDVDPQAIEEAVSALPKSACKHVNRMREVVEGHLAPSHERAWEAIRDAMKWSTR